jgi:predicted KAP-like P-loop ATPase
VNWLRAAKLSAGSALALSLGLPPVGLLGELWNVGKGALDGVDQKEINEAEGVAGKTVKTVRGLLNAKPHTSPPQEIQALRDNFEETLHDMDVTLVVLIDDLDRCLPETTISTLEAVRLFLFLRNAAFVIAADNDMIKHAVRQHFQGLEGDDDLITSYFDKLIQVPIRVPALGTQEVRAYMMLLFIENSSLEEDVKETIRSKICEQLTQTWQGKRVDRAFVQTLHKNFPNELISQFDAADRLAPLMTSASGIIGNPRVIKRFLNALAIRMTISNAHGVGVDEAVLAKMLLFERLGNRNAYAQLIGTVSAHDQGKPAFLAEWEESAHAGKPLSLEPPWNEPFVQEWLILPPRLADRDLRGALYVSREHAPLITPEDRLSSEGAELLGALLQHPDMAESLKDRLVTLPRSEIVVIMDRLLDRARQEQEWGVPPILEACLLVSKADPSQGARLAAFLRERPSTQIQPSIVPKIGDEPWSRTVFDVWEKANVAQPVKNSIRNRKKNGNVPV